jgi:hypothetical protein
VPIASERPSATMPAMTEPSGPKLGSTSRRTAASRMAHSNTWGSTSPFTSMVPAAKRNVCPDQG